MRMRRMSKTNIEALQSELEQLKAQVALRDSIISHYDAELDIETALDHVTFDRHGNIVAYSPPAAAEQTGDGQEGSQQSQGTGEGGESQSGESQSGQSQGGESQSGESQGGESSSNSSQQSGSKSVAAVLKSRAKQSSASAQPKPMREMSMKERVAEMRKHYPNRAQATLAGAGARANSSDN